MRILFDHGTPVPLIPFPKGHTVTKAKDQGWDTLTNGELLIEAERAGFDLLLTADKNMRYQQNLKGRKIAIVMLSLHSGQSFDCTSERLQRHLTARLRAATAR